MGRTIVERELTKPVVLCLPDGRLNPHSIGWARTPLHDTSGIDGRTSWGRNKRWEYWAVTTPTHIVSLTVSSLDYAAVHGIMIHDIKSGATVERGAVAPLGTSATLPVSLATSSARARTKTVSIDIDEVPGGTRLRGSAAGVAFDITALRPDGHEVLAVVVPWSRKRFQYTVKDVARPAEGWLEVNGVRIGLTAGESWAVLDHGRGRWPYRMQWNWGAASGVDGGRTIGLQLGGKWTDGTGSSENGVLVADKMHKISEELDWEYDENDWLSPWRIRGNSIDVEFVPFWDHTSSTELVLFGSRGHQCFGHYSGWVDTEIGRVRFESLLGWAEDVRNRW